MVDCNGHERGEVAGGPDVSVVLPTYNEAENVPRLVPRICEALQRAGIGGEVIVVDDHSPDGTAELARGLAAELPVRVQLRTGERGLAAAVLAGFALSSATACVVMDADGSHPPESLPELIRPVLEGRADVVVGSRYMEGGSTPGWPWRRRMMSRGAGLLARGLTRSSDPTSGFMAARRDLLEELHLEPVGFKIVLEVLARARGARVEEVPIAFTDRRFGRSKMSGGVLLKYLRHLGRLYRFRYLGSRD